MTEERVLPGLRVGDGEDGFDQFGMNARWVRRTYRVMSVFYDYWFRVSSYNAPVLDNLRGAVITANHSGTLPFDGMMMWTDIARNTNPPRVARFAVDFFVPNVPFLSLWWARCGAFSGTRGNVQRLLEGGDLMMIFPEGSPGISKPSKEKYKLQTWRVGHAELAIRHRVPVVPVGIVGAEEQMPQLAMIKAFKAFGAPGLPIPATPFPLPVHYHIHYGQPIDLPSRYAAEQADDPEAVAAAAAEVKAAVAALLDKGLAMREGVYA